MLLALVLVLLALAIYLFSTSNTRRVRQLNNGNSNQAPRSGYYRIWTPGTKDNVPGRYYLVSYGVSLETANRVNEQLQAAIGAKTEFVRVTPTGVTLLVFRRAGDYEVDINRYPSNYLYPIGDEANATVDDVFKLEASGSSLLLRTSKRFGEQTISPCLSSKCNTRGALVFNQSTGASSYDLLAQGDGFTLSHGAGKLDLGRTLCPAIKPSTTTDESVLTAYNTLLDKCSSLPTGTGGPHVALLQATSKPRVFYFDRVD